MSAKDRLRRFLLSPVVIALCDSLRNDPQTWRRLGYRPFFAGGVQHNSGRFSIALDDVFGVCVRNHQDEIAAKLSLIEKLVLRRAVKSWVRNYNKQKLMSNSHSILKTFGGETP